jgi:chromosome segregation protein
MRLKKIKLAGFKSFVDPTTLELPSNLVAVVGPNGCGKSNVIDAVRWVMGESSAKNLRGESMSDVIFNGSTSRKPVGQASIEMVFDNSDGTFGGQYASYAEISIRRHATRDNQSNYFLNGTRCRRKDITDIFLGTGLGPRSYAIIEQGMISRVIEAKPEDLRAFLEEAAGISLYRKRRQETETRMRHTRENLARLDDVRQEIEKQLERLKRQSESAERYRQLKQEQDQLEAELSTLRWRILDEQRQERSLLIRTQAAMLEEKMAGRASVDLDLEQLRDTHTEKADTYQKVQGRYYDLGAQIARSEQTLQNIRERQQQLQADLVQTEQSIEHLNAQLGSDSERLETLDKEMSEIGPSALNVSETAHQARALLQKSEEAMRSWTEGFEEFQRQAEIPQRTAEVEKARIEQFDKQSREADAQLKRLQHEWGQLETVVDDQDIVLLEKELLDREQEGEHRTQTLSSLQQSLTDIHRRYETITQVLDEAKGKRHSLKGRLVSLEALQQAALGKTDGVITAWLKKAELDTRPRLGQELEVEPGYECAVETVLGSALEAVCLNGLDGMTDKLAELERGSLTFIDADTNVQESGSSASVGLILNKGTLLSSKIKTTLPVQDFCAGVYVVDELHQALRMRHQLSAMESIITRDGLWCGPHWLRVYRGEEGQSGVLARETEIKSLHENLEALDETITDLEHQYEDNRQRRIQLEQEREVISRSEHDQVHVIKKLSAKLSTERSRLEHVRERLSRIEIDIIEQKQKLSMGQEDTAIARLKLQSALDAMSDFIERRAGLQAERDTLRNLVQQSTREMREAEEQAHHFALKEQALKSQREATILGIERLKEHALSAGERGKNLHIALKECVDPQAELREMLETQLDQRLREEDVLNRAREALDHLEQKLRHLEKQRTQFEQEAEHIRSQLDQTRMDWQALEVRQQTVQEKLTTLGVDVTQMLQTLPNEANENEWNQRLEQVISRIQRLGAINLAAIEEYQTEQERKNYLDSQYQDLTSALETLENAIRKIDKETRLRFKETFEKVNAEFQVLFPRLFGGGQAYLDLVGDDLLEAGVSVMARPPGKRNSSIHLLSGGEKALTAVAMVFAIFQLNPAPFCMLDEVDAPLDDANVGRFSQLVKHMSSNVQFIFVTHNKIAMETATHLIGVTMKEPGVSRLVSVDVSEAVELVAS